MLTFLFWNIQKKPLLHRVARIAHAHAVGVVILAECDQSDAELLAVLNAGGANFYCPPRVFDTFRVAVRGPTVRLSGVFDEVSGRLSMFKVTSGRKPTLLLAVVHLPSKQSQGEGIHARIAGEIRRIESQRRISRTIAVGDFNRSPFDDVVISAMGFHAMMTRDLTHRRNMRVLGGQEYATFFNPMWQFLTDRGSSPAGTYYFRESVEQNLYWYALDQVLVRPELVDKLKSVVILDTDGSETLLNRTHGWPDSVACSDHLPLLFALDW